MIETADKIKRPLDYILKHGFLKIDHAIHTVLLERPVDPEDEDGDLQYAFKALDLALDMAYDAGACRSQFYVKDFIRHYPEYDRCIWNYYQDGQDDHRRSKIIKKLRAEAVGRTGTVTVYCHRGHNQVQVDASDPWDECAACGAIMRTHDRGDYYDVLVACGQAM